MRNERGSTLILVLLISTVFLILGLAVFSSVIGGTTRTESRKNEAAATQGSIEEINKITADFQERIGKLSQSGNLQDLLETGAYHSKLDSIIQELELAHSQVDGANSRTLAIKDHTDTLLPDSAVDITRHYFTRYYEFILTYVENPDAAHPTITKTVRRNMYISPTPSFLQYTVGSEQNLYLNGASHIVGNVYGNGIYTGDAAKYVNESNVTDLTSISYKTAPALYPEVQGDMIVKDKLHIYKGSPAGEGTALRVLSKHQLAFQQKESFLPSFYTEDGQTDTLPNIYKAYQPFVPVSFEDTFTDRLKQLGLGEESLPLVEGETAPQDIYLIEKDRNPADIALNFRNVPKKAIVLADLAGTAAPEASPTFILNSDLRLSPEQWLVVYGNLEIYSSRNHPVSIEGNILVMGDISIHGDTMDFTHEQDMVAFDSTIYATGKATIFSTNITGIDGKQLVLLTKGDLLLTRINEFMEAGEEIVPMDAFLYTEQKAELYGVGSLFQIHGGLFAKESLTINAIRQKTVQKPLTQTSGNIVTADLQLQTPGQQRGEPSRFTVEYDRSVLLDQMDALPQVDTLQVLLDDYVIEAGDTEQSP